jgi:hypothetical protein
MTSADSNKEDWLTGVKDLGSTRRHSSGKIIIKMKDYKFLFLKEILCLRIKGKSSAVL